MSNNKALGRGLGSLIPQKKENKDLLAQAGDKNEKKSQEVLEIEVKKIESNPWQPRGNFNSGSLEELKDSIKIHGIIQPLVATEIQGGYELVAGERRLRAAKALGLKTVPVILRKVEKMEKLVLAIIENIQREDLNPIEKGFAYKRLIEEFGFSQKEVSQKLGKPNSVISNTIRYLKLPEEIKEAIIKGRIEEGHAKVIVGLESEEKQKQLFQRVVQSKLTVRDTEKEFRRLSEKKYIKNDRGRDLNLKEKEEILEKILNTKVKIEKRRQGGRIIINYYSEEELEAMVNKISRDKT